MTRAELNQYIDDNVTDKTAVDSLSPTDEGNSMKQIADYVDQEVALKENAANKSNDSELGTSDILFPTQNAVKEFVEDRLALKANTADLGAAAFSNDYNDLDNIPTIVTKTLKTTITLSEVRNLFTVPKVILTSTSTISRFPLAIYITRTDTTNYTLANDYFDIVNSGGGAYGMNIPCAILNFSGQAYVYSALNLQFNGNPLNESSFSLKANVGNPTGGAGGLDVYVTYIETDIS